MKQAPEDAPRTILLASTNAGKLAELRGLARGLPYRIVSPADLPFPLPEVVEDGATFGENAVKKALSAAHAAREAGVDLWSVADDSGLMVDALQGEPGVRSSRFAGCQGDPAVRDRANNDLLLARLESVPDGERTARFVCVMAVASGDRVLLTVEGAVEGVILREPRGTSGFGYDPLFHHEPSGASFAELDPTAKGRVSHRGAAMRRLRAELARMTGHERDHGPRSAGS
jgi:XTP/dITP diphosphohydrolase